jgi:hypothetical protein
MGYLGSKTMSQELKIKSKCCSTECDGHATGETLRLFLEKKKTTQNI